MTPMTRYKEVLSVCPDCASIKIIQDGESGETVCKDCGLVIAELNLNTGPEWRSFNLKQQEKRSRVGPPPSFRYHDKGLSTVIGPIYRDAQGRSLPQETRNTMSRQKRWNKRYTADSSEGGNLARALTDITKISNKMHIPYMVQERAALIYRRAKKKGHVRGQGILSMAATSLYIACRLTQTPRTLEEFARHSYLDKRKIARCYRVLLRELKFRVPLPNPQLYVHKIASEMDLGEETQRIAIVILGAAKRFRMTVGKDPMGIAAAALHLACMMNGENGNQNMLANAADVTEITLRSRCKELESFLYPAFSGSKSLAI